MRGSKKMRWFVWKQRMMTGKGQERMSEAEEVKRDRRNFFDLSFNRGLDNSGVSSANDMEISYE